MNRTAGSVLVSLLLLTTVANARNTQPLRAIDQTQTARESAMTAIKRDAANSVQTLEIRAQDACTHKSLSPPATIQGNLSALSCYDTVLNSYEDIYDVTGHAGQTLTIDFSSTAFDVFLWMEGVDTARVSFLDSGVSRKTITYTFTQTQTFKLEAETLYGPGDASPHSGPYTLVASFGGSSSTCTENATNMCLSGSRFLVSATYRTTDGQSGSGQAVRITSDTGYFTFFSASNVEVILKVLNACTFNQRYWVFIGGLTNVNVVITVRDTQTGVTKTYTNPINTAFQPIQDTSALATCP